MPRGVNEAESYERPDAHGVTYVMLPFGVGRGRIVPPGWMQFRYKVRADELREDGGQLQANGWCFRFVRAGSLLMPNGSLIEGVIVAMWQVT